MLVVEVGIDNKTGMESYRLLYYSPVEGSEDLPWNQTPSVATILAGEHFGVLMQQVDERTLARRDVEALARYRI